MEDTTNILVFGDSNTWGYDCRTGGRFPHAKRWTTILQKELGPEFNIIPEGLNGRTCIQESPCLFEDGEYEFNGRKHLPAIVHSHKPLDIIVIGLGTNDTKIRFQNSENEIVQSVRVLVRDLQKMTNIGRLSVVSGRLETICYPKIIVMSLPTINFVYPYSEMYGLPPDVSNIAKRVNTLLEMECKRMNVSFINTEIVGISNLDGLHFDLEHMESLAELVKREIYRVTSHN